ncbi:Rad17-domain-containing protein [Russula earlei]|uniref:Rad17-domain-containing protein n=1 Tax=Russula earlei TaxID=71964 RepID=A0ACC0UC78_9AGAM|nr:Rad17-domain-containing protein [Russula earlei]
MPLKPASRIKHKSTLKVDSLPPSKKLKSAKDTTVLSPPPRPPLTLVSKPLSVPLVPGIVGDAKGKGKATSGVHEECLDDCLWVDKYGPQSFQDLAVHKRKVDDVHRWLVEAFSGKGRSSKHRRLLVLTGPAGSAKTATLHVLAREMDFEIVEYKNVVTTTQYSAFADERSTSDAFANFLTRAGAYTSVFTSTRRKLVLVEDLPNILHPAVRSRFHDALRAHVEREWDVAPLVLVISDAGARAEGDSNGERSRDQVIDARTVIPLGLSSTFLLSEIRFNPIAPTLLTSAVKRVATLTNVRLSPNTLHSIVEGAGGDVRSAIMTLEFSCARPTSRKKTASPSVGSIVSASQREDALLLFHLMGKIMYNKRKGDPPSRSASAKDVARERAIDRSLEDPPGLPPWLATEERRTSRVNVDMLYASTPIDPSLFGLYIHQNYTQFCSSLEQCSLLIDNLSWADAHGSENWYDVNPHAFHIQALGTLHSLPSPVPRTGQQFYKPEFFGARQREQVARDALEHVSSWLSGAGIRSRVAVVTELGGVLRGMGRHAPHGHHAFSELVFGQDFVGPEVINEGDDGERRTVDHEEGEGSRAHTSVEWPEQVTGCGYLEDDDIEDW